MNPTRNSKGRIDVFPNPPYSPYNPETDIFYFPPIRIAESPPPGPVDSSPSGPRATQESSEQAKGSRYYRYQKPESKRKAPGGAENTSPLKKLRFSSGNHDDEIDIRRLRDEIIGFRKDLEKLATEVREERLAIQGTLKQILSQVRRKS